jgi:hypothetical protein
MAKGKCSCSGDNETDGKNPYDEPVSPEDMADTFALYGLNKRAAALQNIDGELQAEVGSGAHALRRHARLIGLRQKMSDMHAALRKAKR